MSNRKKTPTVLQMEALECGAASLGIILGYYKRFVPLEQLRVDCGVSRDGSRASYIVKAAKNYGLSGEGYQVPGSDLLDKKYDKNLLITPGIIFWKKNHFVVYEGCSGDKVFINDPATGPRTVMREQFLKDYSNIYIDFRKNDTFQRGGEPTKILPLLNERIQGHKKSLMFLFFCGIGLTTLGLITPLFSKLFIDKIMIANLDSVFKPLVLSMVFVALVQIGVMLLKQYHSFKLKHKMSITFSTKFFSHMLNLPIDFFEQRHPGDLANRLGLNETLASALSEIYVTFIINIIMLFAYLSLMFFFDTTLTFIALAIAFLNIAITMMVSRLRKDKSLQMSTETSALQGQAYMGIRLIESLKAQGRERDLFAKIAGRQSKISNIMQELASRTMFASQVPPLLSQLSTTAILALGCYKVIASEMTVGTLFAFQFLAMSFIGPLNTLLGTISQVQGLMGNLNRLNDIHNYPPCQKVDVWQLKQEELARIQNTKLEGRIEIKQVSFGYNKLAPPLLKNFSLSIAPSERVAIVGRSGSGKSTLAKLLSNLYEPWEGTILVDGLLLNEINRLVFVNSCSMVDQSISMFEGTIAENLTMWDYNPDMWKLIRSAKDACIHDFIISHPLGYEHQLLEAGNNISGGQMQRLEIARALYTDPSIIILDEATSALDPITEHRVLSNIKRRGCTTITIAHRLSTIKDADHIIVVEDGRICEMGVHQALLAKNGIYAELVGVK